MRRLRAFSLVEALVVLALSAILLTITLSSFSGTTHKVGSGELAQFLAAELQAARLRAIGNKSFAGVVFPSDNGSKGVCRSFSFFESCGKLKTQRSRETQNDFPDSDIFVGTWPTSGASFTLDRPATGFDPNGLDLSSMFSPSPVPKDFLLVFSPTGTVNSNGLPLLNGQYHLIVGQGIEYGPQAAPPGTPPNPSSYPSPSYFQMSALSAPWHISLSPMGRIQAQAGLPEQGPGLTIKSNSVGSTSVALPAMLGYTSSNSPPTVERVSLSPRAASDLPTSIEGLIGSEEFLRLTVEASDVDGDRLTCRWTASGGRFSSPDQDGAMWFNDSTKRWQSTWSFRADPKDLPGKVYDLKCEVRDQKGALGVAAAGVQLVLNIELRQRPKVVFSEFPVRGIFSCGTDGSDLQQLPTGGLQPEMPSFHPDGNTIMFHHYDWNTAISQMYSVNRDGSNLRMLVGHSSHSGAYSPDGTKIACAVSGQLTIAPSCGTVSPIPGSPPAYTIAHPGYYVGYATPSFSQDGKKLCFQARQTGRPLHDNVEYLFIVDVDNKTVLHQIGGPINQVPSFPNGGDNLVEGIYCRDPAYPNLLLCTVVTTDGTTRKLYLMNDDGSNVRDVPVMGGYVFSPAWSKDGKSIVYSNGVGLVSADIDVVNAKLSNEKQILNWDRAPHQIVSW